MTGEVRLLIQKPLLLRQSWAARTRLALLWFLPAAEKARRLGLAGEVWPSPQTMARTRGGIVSPRGISAFAARSLIDEDRSAYRSPAAPFSATSSPKTSPVAGSISGVPSRGDSPATESS